MENSQPANSEMNGTTTTAPQESPSALPPSMQDPSSTSRHSRVTSTVAQSFAADLDSMFGLSNGGGPGSGQGVDVLSTTVAEKKQTLNHNQSELEQLEAKLRETEQRLARVSRQNSPSRQATAGAAPPPGNAIPLRGEGEQRQPHPLAQKPTYPADRPPTAPRQDTQKLMQGMPGAMPGTPAGAEGAREDYVMVDEGRRR